MDQVAGLVLLLGFGLTVAVIVGLYQCVSYLQRISERVDQIAQAIAPATSAGGTEAAHPAAGPRAKPGWYPDPSDPTVERRWTGKEWGSNQPRPAKTRKWLG